MSPSPMTVMLPMLRPMARSSATRSTTPAPAVRIRSIAAALPPRSPLPSCQSARATTKVSVPGVECLRVGVQASTAAISLWPNIVPPSLSFWEASAPASSQAFTLVGVTFMVPIILIYTAYSYWVFRGKVKVGEGYH